jgi:LETM1 and EF-hand domain-containing protein 1
MASRAIIRRRKYALEHTNIPVLLRHSSISTFGQEKFGCEIEQSTASQNSRESNHEKAQYILRKQGLLGLSILCHPTRGASLASYESKPQTFGFPLGARYFLQSVRPTSSTAGQPKVGILDERSENQNQNQGKKEASPEECDQAVEGLSTAKAKAKAKLVQEVQKSDQSIIHKFWAILLGIGPALRAVASMSRADWAAKLKHWKDEFVSTLQHYWLGTKLLWADVRISSRLLVKLAGGKSLTRRERQQLTRTTADLFRLVPFAVFIIVPFMEFLLPVFLKMFPNMLPSTFQDKMKEEEALKRKLKARMEYARFLQDTAKEMAKEVQTSRSGEMKQTAEDLDEFLNKVLGSYMFCLLPQVEYIDH